MLDLCGAKLLSAAKLMVALQPSGRRCPINQRRELPRTRLQTVPKRSNGPAILQYCLRSRRHYLRTIGWPTANVQDTIPMEHRILQAPSCHLLACNPRMALLTVAVAPTTPLSWHWRAPASISTRALLLCVLTFHCPQQGSGRN